jgi:hypothetical protein
MEDLAEGFCVPDTFVTQSVLVMVTAENTKELLDRSCVLPTYLEKITMQRSCTKKNGSQIEGHVKDRIGTSLQVAIGKQRLSLEL